MLSAFLDSLSGSVWEYPGSFFMALCHLPELLHEQSPRNRKTCWWITQSTLWTNGSSRNLACFHKFVYRHQHSHHFSICLKKLTSINSATKLSRFLKNKLFINYTYIWFKLFIKNTSNSNTKSLSPCYHYFCIGHDF